MLILAFAILLALPATDPAQVSGHGSVPASGPAAQEQGRPALDDDPVLVQLERIRDDLGAVAKRYRKAKAAERPELARRLAPALEEIAGQVARLGHDPAQQPLR